MKSYTFTLPKNTKSAKTYKESLMDRVINAYPWMTVELSLIHIQMCIRDRAYIASNRVIRLR